MTLTGEDCEGVDHPEGTRLLHSLLPSGGPDFQEMLAYGVAYGATWKLTC